ncbi:hypothetical protein SESBI_14128, partial [Sesbania bispinosa]
TTISCHLLNAKTLPLKLLLKIMVCMRLPEVSMAHIPEANLVEDLWQPFESNGLELEAEDVDCIWSSLLNKPL